MEKYLEMDGTLDTAALEEAIKRAELDEIQTERVKQNPCHCQCHIKGTKVLH